MGKLILWYCLGIGDTGKCLSSAGQDAKVEVVGSEEGLTTADKNKRKKITTSSLHWHAHVLSSLAFVGNGNVLLSGGEEAVLVLWHLDSGTKSFLPRRGGTRIFNPHLILPKHVFFV